MVLVAKRNPLRNLLTTRDAADQLGVGPQAILMAIHRWRDGRSGLRATQYGRDWFIEPKDLKAYAERPTRKSRDPRKGRKGTPDNETT
jgi:hypothetical protein